jgi:hypothetical protein
MFIYSYGRSATSAAPRQQIQSSKRRYSVEAWTRLRDQVDREHRAITHADPRSPRIKPSVGTLTDGGAR